MRKVIALGLFVVFTFLLTQPALACARGTLRFAQKSDSLTETQYQYRLEVAFPNLLFDKPVGIYHAGDGTDRLFVVEQQGVVYVFENSEEVATANVFLDIRDRVLFGGEQGLLGLAFHPSFSENGYFYVDYTADSPRRTIIARYSVTLDDPNEADKNSEEVLLEVEQPFANHNGGQITFGPDGYLYIALGDGGSAGDPLGNGQNRSTLLGSILRIDVDSTSGVANYGIPSDNPFVDNTEGYREEIYAYGLRNPWRFSFDPESGWLWAADVGQNRIEEIDIIEKGKNYGWNIMEGSLCYSPSEGCNQTGLELPIWEYGHGLGNSVTGGFVYRGSKLTDLIGAYIYGDYGSGRIWALRFDGINDPVNTELLETNLNIPSFGVDEENEILICAFDGRIYKLTSVVNIHLFGSAAKGWGFTEENITSPGPTITAKEGDLVNLTLTSADGITHNFFVDYDGDVNPNVGEPKSLDFQTTTINYQFAATIPGTFTYYCQYHKGTMFGTFIVAQIKLLGDLNNNGIVDIFDVVAVAVAFGAEPRDPNWNPVADLNNDDVVDIFDVVTVATNFGKTA